MSGRNPKGAALGQSHYESDDIAACFQPIIKPLLRDLEPHEIQFTARELSLLVGQLQQFQQDCLGAFNRPTVAPIRIPVKLFKVTKELSKESVLYIILFSAYTFRLKHNWKKWDFSNPSKKQKNADLLQFVREQLIAHNMISIPKVYIVESETDSVRKSITTLIKKLDATLVDDKSEATHIVHGPLHRHGEGPEEDWFRTLEKDGNLVLVHWWYYPDSFDSWLPQTQQFTDPEEAPEHNGPWCVSARWLQDSVRFNELMNEEDYEDSEEEEEEEEEDEEEDEMEEEEMEEEGDMEEENEAAINNNNKSAHSNKKQKTSHIPNEISTPINIISTATTAANSEVATPDTPSFKELIPTISVDYPGFNSSQGMLVQPPLPIHNPGHQPIVRVRDIEAERPQVGSRQRKNEFEPYTNGDMINISQYTARHVDYPKRSTATATKKQPQQQQQQEEKEKEKEDSDDNNDDDVDDDDDDDDDDEKVETETQGGNEPDIPLLIRPTPCDYDDITLPSWLDENIISDFERLALPEFFDESNQEFTPQDYQLCRDYMIEKYKANPDYYLTISACKAHFEYDLVILVRIHSFLEHSGVINNRIDPRRRIFDPFIDSDPESLIQSDSQRNFKDIDHADLEYLRKLIFDPTHSKPARSPWDLDAEDHIQTDGRKVFNCYNCNTDCSPIRYQSLKTKDASICIDCFLEGRFPATTFSGDYLRVETGPEIHELDEEWSDAEILRLLEGVDKYDDDWLLISELVSTRSKEQCITKFLQLPINDEFLTATLSKIEKEQLPFSDTPNPVMTMTSFLAGHINPGVGAAAAKEALKALLQSGEGVEPEKKIERSKQEENRTKDGDDSDSDSDNGEQEVKVNMEISEEEEEEEEKEKEDEMDIDEEEYKTSTGAFSESTIIRATEAALKSGIENTLKLASYEDQEIQHWTRLAVQTIVDKLVLKVLQYDELETSLENELKEIEKQQNILATSIESLSKQHFPLPSAEAVGTEVVTSQPVTTPSIAQNTTINYSGIATATMPVTSMPILAPTPVSVTSSSASTPTIPLATTNEVDKPQF